MRRSWLIPAMVVMVTGACETRGRGDADQGGDERRTGQVERTPTGGAHDTLMGGRVDPGTAGGGADAAAGAQALGMMYAADNLEMQTAQLALQHGRSPAVKRLATRIAQEHQAHRQQVESVSERARMEATPPTNAVVEQTRAQDRLAGKTGAEFDREFLALQVEAHEKNIAELERMRGAVRNAEVRQLIDTTLPALRAHLEAAQDAQRSLGR